MMIEASKAGYVVELVWDGSQQRALQFDWYLPPIEWLGMLGLVVAALCKEHARKLSSQPAGGPLKHSLAPTDTRESRTPNGSGAEDLISLGKYLARRRQQERDDLHTVVC